MIRVIQNTEFGDATLNQNIDAEDLAIVRTKFGAEPAGWADGNVTLPDDVVDAADLASIRSNFGFAASPAAPAPEPAALVWISLGGLALAAAARRGRRRS